MQAMHLRNVPAFRQDLFVVRLPRYPNPGPEGDCARRDLDLGEQDDYYRHYRPD